MSRIVCHFSCGAASAVATKLTVFPHQLISGTKVEIVNAFIAEEDADNRRFLTDCERWFGQPITVLQDEKYGASIDEVWRRENYMKGPHGAPCSKLLKRRILDKFALPDDLHVLGFTAEENDRFDDMQQRNPRFRISAPLVERGITKSDCLALVERAGIELPRMYRLGFENANCPGCPKGGEGYWNRIRVIFPEVFRARLERQESIGKGAYFFRNRTTGERFGLKDLDPMAGRHNEPSPECSFFCQLAEQEIS